MGYIYCITNKVNNKKYVGQTRIDVQVRFSQHLHNKPSHYMPIITQAVRKHGKKNFEVVTLEVCDDKDINEREKFWIKELDTFRNGYNQTIGGEGGTTVTDDDKKMIETLFLKHWNIMEVADILKKEKSTIREHLNNMGYTTRDIQIYKQALLYEKYAMIRSVYDQLGTIRHTAKAVGMERRRTSIILRKTGVQTLSFDESKGWKNTRRGKNDIHTI
jgi:predicted DNA-binding protein YlxM (UPF0122 family)